MIRPRVIPVLLLSEGGLVKTRRFKAPVYVGDPINAVRIFNDKSCDELVLLDIEASRKRRPPNFALIEEIAGECFMPLSYGGGIVSLDQARRIIRLGVEKLVLNSAAAERPALLTEIADQFGSQAVVASVDVGKNFLGQWRVRYCCGTKALSYNPVEYVQKLVQAGAGEIFLNCIDRDGEMSGYELPLIREISDACNVPVIACGGAASLSDLTLARTEGHAAAAAAGALFVFQGPHRAVLINYPSESFFSASNTG